MAKGPKQPRTNKEVLDRIIVLALDKANLLGKEIKKQLEEEFDPNAVPGLRTIQQYMSNARKEAEENVQEQPWSLAAMNKAGIPWEATHFLLEASIEMQKENSKLWPETGTLIEELYERKFIAEWSPPETGVMTVRQAKWLWRIHLALPDVKLRNIFWRADIYSEREMITDYLGFPFDTEDLDSALRNLLRNIKDRGISAKKEKKTKITGKEE